MTDTRPVDSLRPHPDNGRIYGDEIDAEFLESVRAEGVLAPLLVSHDDRIISGHRRWRAARECGLAEVRVEVFASQDEADILSALIHSNRARLRTNTMIAREAQALMGVEKERAKRRQQSTLKQNVPATVQENFPERSIGQARDKVGAAIGLSGPTTQRALKVIEKVDELRSAGSEEEAARIERKLNKSVLGAYKEILPVSKSEKSGPKKEDESGPAASATAAPVDEVEAASREFLRIRLAARKLRDEAVKLLDGPGGHFLKKSLSKRNAKGDRFQGLDEFITLLYTNRPVVRGCLACNGEPGGCAICCGLGYLPRRFLTDLAKKYGQEAVDAMPRIGTRD